MFNNVASDSVSHSVLYNVIPEIKIQPRTAVSYFDVLLYCPFPTWYVIYQIIDHIGKGSSQYI